MIKNGRKIEIFRKQEIQKIRNLNEEKQRNNEK